MQVSSRPAPRSSGSNQTPNAKPPQCKQIGVKTGPPDLFGTTCTTPPPSALYRRLPRVALRHSSHDGPATNARTVRRGSHTPLLHPAAPSLRAVPPPRRAPNLKNGIRPPDPVRPSRRGEGRTAPGGVVVSGAPHATQLARPGAGSSLPIHMLGTRTRSESGCAGCARGHLRGRSGRDSLVSRRQVKERQCLMPCIAPTN